MASFDTAVPTENIPDWTKVSRPIQQPESITVGDKSKGIALNTIASGLEEGSKLAETTMESFLKNKVTTGVDKLRDDYTDAYTQLRDMQDGVIPAPQQTLAQANTTPPVPGGLQAGLDKVKQLATAQTQNLGKVNDTLYTMNLNSLAKQLRAQYPGHRDYIDEQIKAVSGIDPANAVMRNLLEDINSNSANAKSEYDKISTMVRDAVQTGVGGYNKAGIPNAQILATLWFSGKATPADVYGYLAKYSASEWQRKQEMADRANDQGRLSDIQTRVEQSFARNAAHDVQAALDVSKIAGGIYTAQGLHEFLTKSNAEGATVDPGKLDQAMMGLTALRTQLEATLRRKAIEPDANGNTTESLIGPDKVTAHINEQLKPLDAYIKFIGDNQHGLAGAADRQSAAVVSTTQRDLLKHPTIGPQMAMIAAMQKLSPVWADSVYKGGLLKGLDKDLVPVYLEGVGGIATQLDPLHPETVKGLIQHAKDKGIQPSTRFLDEVVKIPDLLTDPKTPDEAKLNIAKGAYDPRNWDLMNEFRMDYYNPKTKQNVPGQYAAFGHMMSDEIIDNMWKLKGTGPEGVQAWSNMKKFGEHEASIMLREDLHNLVAANQTYKFNKNAQSVGSGELPGTKFKIEWDNDPKNPHFKELEFKGSPYTPVIQNPDNQYADSVNRIIRRVNGALEQMTKVYSKEGKEGSTDAYLMGILQNSDPAVKEITQPMVKSILTSHQQSAEKLQQMFREREEQRKE